MAAPARTLETLRAALRERFGAEIDPGLRDRARSGVAMPSGWTAVDRALDGGLRPGRSAAIEGSPGAGSLALAASWAAEVCKRAEPVFVLDPSGTALPHAWIEPEEARAPIWIARVGGGELWPALDIALRSGAFGLAVLLEPSRAPPGVGLRIKRLAQSHGARVVLTHWPGHAPPWTPSHRVRLAAGSVRWVSGPTGSVPVERDLEVSCDAEREETRRSHEVFTDRMHPAPLAPDRRASSGRGGRKRRAR